MDMRNLLRRAAKIDREKLGPLARLMANTALSFLVALLVFIVVFLAFFPQFFSLFSYQEREIEALREEVSRLNEALSEKKALQTRQEKSAKTGDASQNEKTADEQRCAPTASDSATSP